MGVPIGHTALINIYGGVKKPFNKSPSRFDFPVYYVHFIIPPICVCFVCHVQRTSPARNLTVTKIRI